MSVPSWKRKESKVLYIDRAWELHLETLRLAVSLPKSARFLITTDLTSSAKKVLENCLIANRLRDKEKRIGILTETLGELDLIELLYINAIDIYGFKKKADNGKDTFGEIAVTKIGTLLNDERRLISGVISSDRKIACNDIAEEHSENMPYPSNSNNFCQVNNDGNTDNNNANNVWGVSPDLH